MKRICFIAPKAYPLLQHALRSKFGGAEIQLYVLAKELAKDNSYAVSMVVGDYRQKPTEHIDGIEFIKAINYKDNFLLQAYRFLKALKEINADIYVHTSLTVFSGIIAFYVRLLGKKMVYRVSHDAETDGGSHRKDGFFKYLLSPLVFRCARAVIVQNSYQARNLEKKKIAAVLIRSAQHCPEDIVQPHHRDIVLWVGRDKRWKQPELFLKLSKEFPSITFVMICQDARNGHAAYQALRKEAENITNVEFLSFVPFDKINTYFDRAKVFVNTSVQEGFPNTFLQSCAAHAPILSYTVNPDNFLTEYRCGVCADGDWQRFVDGMKQLLDEAGAKEFGENGFNYVERNHSIQNITRQYKDLFNSLSS